MAEFARSLENVAASGTRGSEAQSGMEGGQGGVDEGGKSRGPGETGAQASAADNAEGVGESSVGSSVSSAAEQAEGAAESSAGGAIRNGSQITRSEMDRNLAEVEHAARV